MSSQIKLKIQEIGTEYLGLVHSGTDMTLFPKNVSSNWELKCKNPKQIK